MSTALVIGNGSLLVNLDNNLNVSDLYWPHIGQENHLAKLANEIFLRVNGEFTNFTDGNWELKPAYVENTLTGRSTAFSSKFKLKIIFEDFVLQNRDIFIRYVTVENMNENLQEIFFYFKSNYYLLGDDVGDTALWYTPAQALVHYKKDRYIGSGSTGQIYQFSCAGPEDNEKQGAVPDWNTGELWNNVVATGSVQSCISFRFQLNPNEIKKIDYFTICGTCYDDIETAARYLRTHDPQEMVDRTTSYWQKWVETKVDNYFAGDVPKIFADEKLNDKLLWLYKHSLLVIRSQCDNQGAVLAANYSTFVKMGGKDTYSYFWPRDGAMVITALIDVGFSDLAKKFFRFCKRALTKDGYLLHKYYPNLKDGIGSSWHPWVDKGGNLQLPIQEDETALVLIALWKYYERFADQEFLNEMWDSFIERAADFLVKHRYLESEKAEDIKTYVGGMQGSSDDILLDLSFSQSGLPKPSYDLWEEQRGIHAFTVAAVHAGLKAAANLGKNYGHVKKAEEYELAAKEVKAAFEKYLYDASNGRFITMIYCDAVQKACVLDKTIDSSLYALWAFDMFSLNDLRVELSIKAIEENLWIKTPIGGFARKENDFYLKDINNKEIPGNPWFIPTLWMTQYWIRKRNLDKARKYLAWVLEHIDETGLIAEQADPYTGFAKSVKPLTWSHAELVRTVNMLKSAE